MTDENKNSTNATLRLRNLLAALLAAVLFAPLANAAETVAAGTPAYPAALNGSCDGSDCTSTLYSEHEITFISRHSFPVGNALLTRDAQGELLRLLAELESFAVIKHVEIVGHADPSGPENYNRWISEIRARRVQRYFAQNGVDPRKISLRGAGASEPLVGAIDAAEHRRVEVHITLQPFL